MIVRTPTISACLIVRNESLVRERCLSSLSGVVDEIVVVDTGSTDATPEIAAGFGARICRDDWRNDFSAARNVGLDAACCDWILTIDADEYLSDATQPQVRAIVDRTDADGVLVTVRNLLAADDLIQSAESQIVRLFRRRDDVRFAGITYQHLGRHVDAQRHLVQVLELPNEQLNPEILANAAVRLAQLAMGERRADSVVHYAGRALAFEPNHVLAHYLSGLARMRLGR